MTNLQIALILALGVVAGIALRPGIERLQRYRRFRRVLGYPRERAWHLSRENYLA